MDREVRTMVRAAMRVALILAGSAALAAAQEAGSGTSGILPQYLADAPKADTNWVDQVKHPVDWFKWGADERMRIPA